MAGLDATLTGDPPPFWLIFIALSWVVFVILASILYRRSKQKPIFPKIPSEAVFVERSGSALFAANCLIVTVTKTSLSVIPRFPFNLMFLPEIYRLEYQFPLARVRSIQTQRSLLLRSNVIVTRDDSKKFRLLVRRPLALASAIQQGMT